MHRAMIALVLFNTSSALMSFQVHEKLVPTMQSYFHHMAPTTGTTNFPFPQFSCTVRLRYSELHKSEFHDIWILISGNRQLYHKCPVNLDDSKSR